MGSPLLYEEEEVDYQSDDVLVLVERIKGNMVISHMNLDINEVFSLVDVLVEKTSKLSGIARNDILNDLKEVE